jgi:hypothetical protein
VDLDLDLRPKDLDLDLDLTISESEDLDLDSDLEEEDLDLDLDLPLWDLTTSLVLSDSHFKSLIKKWPPPGVILVIKSKEQRQRHPQVC